MFHEIPKSIQDRMAFLEAIDRRDRADGTGRLQRLRQIPPETGKFLALLAANAPKGGFVEIGTSAGYSALWLSLALREGEKLTTFEIMPEKIMLARETFWLCNMEERIDLVEGDLLDNADALCDVSFCFIDCEKHLYERCFAVMADKMAPGGLIVADNATNHYECIRPMIALAVNDKRFDCVTVPIGKGEFVCRRK
jgi:predicted O-methyltransferase YrrM